MLEQKLRLALKYTSLYDETIKYKKVHLFLIVVNHVIPEIIRLTLEEIIEVTSRALLIYEL
ncbi:hypothetical protein CIT25_34970 [Mesorhizobium mediterraneum]|uniref:Uncharacterized protein n=1 Tax=Mesorhizobium mediterraneum TaxID=43617 RepID=A0AB36QZV0_9HYPH|nr:hypothetical protein CIT25_34970 [Mesorhizobium mediterraneum]